MPPETLLEQWVIYHNPTDWPGREWVARKWRVTKDGPESTAIALTGSLEGMRREFERQGFVCIGRMDGDDPVIHEVWT